MRQTGLNPGMMAPTPFYNTTNDVQAKYYWGSHPMQTGSLFDAASYNNVPGAPSQAWGLQELAQPISPEELAALIQQSTYQNQFGLADSGYTMPYDFYTKPRY
jgi:hypothetical protein